MEQQGCNTQSQCHSAAQNLLLVKEVPLAPPLPLPEQSQDMPLWLSLGIKLRNGGNDRKENGQELHP